MKLQTRRQLLNFATLSSLALTGAVVWGALSIDLQPNKLEPSKPLTQSLSTKKNGPAKPITAVSLQFDSKQSYWTRSLRGPLYDPPPVVKKKIVKKPRPIPVTLKGTILEPDNSQAFLQQANGKVVLKRIGDLITADERDGIIVEITASEVVIEREDGQVRVAVKGPN